MPYDFRVNTFGTHLVLYDPAAILEGFPFDPDTDLQEPESPPREALLELAKANDALVLELPEGMGEATIRIFVDEPLPDSSCNSGTNWLRKSRLNILSGVLSVDGAEFIHPKPKTRLHASGDSIELPAGSYGLDVVDQVAWKEAHLASYVESRTTRLGRSVDLALTVLGYSVVVLFVCSILIVPAIIWILWKEAGSIAGLAAIGMLVAIWIVIIAGTWCLEWVYRRWPEIRRPQVARSDFEQEYPDILVALRFSPSWHQASSPAFLAVWPDSHQPDAPSK